MRVAIVTSQFGVGGAGLAASRLVQGLRGLPDVECFVCVECLTPGTSSYCFAEGGPLRRLATEGLSVLGMATATWWRGWQQHRNLGNVRLALMRFRPDVINVHGFNQWTLGLSRRGVAALGLVAPLVWTLHDTWPINGRADYAGEDRGLDVGERDSGATPLEGLKDRLCWVGPSYWMTDQARAMYGHRNRCETVPNGLDVEVFRPMEQAAARALWGLEPEARVLLAVAHDVGARRKGISTLACALAGMEVDVRLLLVGDGNVALPPMVARRTVRVGAVGDPRLMRTLYAACDLVVVPSTADNLPNVMLEALACGRPVAGSDIGGIPDAVRPGETGWLVPPSDEAAWRAVLARALNETAADPAGWARRCRTVAEREYSLAVQAGAYLRLFGEMALGAIPGAPA